MSELEPIPYGHPIMREMAHCEDKIERAQEVIKYYTAKHKACVEILRASNIIWVADERWQQ